MISHLNKPRILSKAQIEAAVKFHGHSGPFLVLGLRMGQLALRLLDARGYFDIHCMAELQWSPPDSCVVDGIQFSTGCTMGKHNIAVAEREGVAATFMKDGKSLRIELKPALLEHIRRSFEDRTEEELTEKLIDASDEEIFDIKFI
jgi:formylmethanofuran dehydrogenase subunit E